MPQVKRLSESTRKEIFLAVVQAQDEEMSVPLSRQVVADRFGVDIQQVVAVEREGIDRQWPPL